MKQIVSYIALILLTLPVFSQNDSLKLKFDLTVRYRFELWDGMNAKNYGDNSATAIGKLDDKTLYQRIITGFSYQPVKRLTFALHIQDSRAFGWSLRNSLYPDLFKIHRTGVQSPFYTMNPNEEFFEIYDAYIEYRKVLKNLTIKAGRQKIFYGDNHIFGPGEWGNTGRWTWDAVKLSYKFDNNFVDIFTGGTKIHDPQMISVPFIKTEFWGGGMYAHLYIKNLLNIEPFFAYKKEGSADYIETLNLNRNWLGTRIFNNDFHHTVFDATLVKEFGNESNKPISAFGVFAKAGYQFYFIPFKPILSIRESYASGGKKTDKTLHTFDPAFGAGDKYYGWMNITSWSNLDDREIVLELFPVKGMWIEMKYNRFYIPEPEDARILNTMVMESGKHHFGDEFDVFLRYQILKHWQITSALGYFIPGELSDINNKPPENASWIAFQVLYTSHNNN